MMTRYKNISGHSGIAAYEIGRNYIKLQFSNGIYLYDHKRPGKHHVEQMKTLAVSGLGLATYVNTHVRENYSEKLT